MKTVDPSRRAILAGAPAAVALASLNCAAHAEGSELHRLIETNRAARQAFCAAVNAQEEAKARYNAAYKPILTPSAGCFYGMNYGYDFCKDGIARDFENQRKMLKGLAHLDPAAGGLALAAIDAKEVESLATLDENIAADEPRKKSCGLSAANRMYEETNEAERETALALLAYPCRTIEEARRKVEYILSTPLKDEIHEDELLEALLRSFVGDVADGDQA